MDSAVAIKKKRRMQQLAQQKKDEQAKVVNLMDCDIGASPKLQPLNRKKG